MLESIHIQGFKGFKDTHIGPLRKVNLVVGGQNVGKTSLLEALQIALGPKDIASGLSKLFRQDSQQDTYWSWAMNDLEKVASFDSMWNTEGFGWTLGRQSTVPIRGKLFNNATVAGMSLKITRPESQMAKPTLVQGFSVMPPTMSEIMMAFSQVVEKELDAKLIRELRYIEPKLTDMMLSNAGQPKLMVGMSLPNGRGRVPVQLLGQGINRLIYIVSHLLITQAKVALLDEVENGIHYKALPTVMSGIKNVAQERGVQIFMTTHSWDCIRAACEVFEDSPDDFQVIRLERTEDNIRAVCIDGARMQRLMADDREVR